jgi:hypothetical protein
MIEINGKQGEKVLINIYRRLYPDATQKQDIDYLEASIKLSYPEFTALFRFFIRSSEIEYWLRQKKEFLILGKNIRLTTLEENIVVNLQVDESGDAIWDFELKDQENKSKLYLKLESKMKEVDLFMNQLSNILKLYPIPSYV